MDWLGSLNKKLALISWGATLLVAHTPAHGERAFAPRLALGPLLARHGITLPRGHGQLLLLTTAGWQASRGKLQRYALDRRQESWKAIGRPMAARLGKAGLGRGRGLVTMQKGPRKKEGDRRSPAGVFALGEAFGSLPLSKAQSGRWPWRRVDARDHWVDDPRSPHYNTWQRLARVGQKGPWSSAERLASYRLAIVIAHNMAPIVRGAGSAIFLHIGAMSSPSVGCTILTRRELLRVLRWLRPEAKPLIVQLPDRP